jgi:hypothetical protein
MDINGKRSFGIINLLNINIDGKENFKKIFDLIVIEISKLKHSLDLYQKKLNAFESKILMQEMKMNAHEIVNLFRHYYVDHKIKNEYPNTRNCTEFTGNNHQNCFKICSFFRPMGQKRDANYQIS